MHIVLQKTNHCVSSSSSLNDHSNVYTPQWYGRHTKNILTVVYIYLSSVKEFQLNVKYIKMWIWKCSSHRHSCYVTYILALYYHAQHVTLYGLFIHKNKIFSIVSVCVYCLWFVCLQHKNDHKQKKRQIRRAKAIFQIGCVDRQTQKTKLNDIFITVTVCETKQTPLLFYPYTRQWAESTERWHSIHTAVSRFQP